MQEFGRIGFSGDRKKCIVSSLRHVQKVALQSGVDLLFFIDCLILLEDISNSKAVELSHPS